MHLTIAKDESCLTDEDCQPRGSELPDVRAKLPGAAAVALVLRGPHDALEASTQHRSGSQNRKGDPSISMIAHSSQLTITELWH